MELVVLVNEKGEELGIEEKHKAHREGKLHSAFSIFIFNSKGEMLIQRRAMSKYHSAGLWSNACCSHPRPGEGIEEAAHRRLKEEMGFDCELKELFSFVYYVEFENGLKEHELDHVFVGEYEGKVKPNPKEVEEFRWIKIDELVRSVREAPEKYTYWFKLALPKVLEISYPK